MIGEKKWRNKTKGRELA